MSQETQEISAVVKTDENPFGRLMAKLFLQASLFYVASAGLVLAGIGQVLAPVLGRHELTPEHLSSIGAMFGYEMAVFGVMLLIAVWKKVHDDAISLTLVIGLFLVATPIALNLVAAPFPDLAMGMGGLLFALGLARLGVISGRVVGGISPSVMVILAVFLLVGAIWPGVLGRMVAKGRSDIELLPIWMMGYGIVLGCACLLPAVMVPSGVMAADMGKWDVTPFLKTFAMRWCFSLVLVMGGVVQFYAMAWGFGLKVPGVMLLPALLPLAVAGVVLARAYASKATTDVYVLACIPAVGGVILGLCLPSSANVMTGPLGLVLSPGLVMVFLGTMIGVLGYRLDARRLYAIGAITASLGLGLIGRNHFESDLGQGFAGMCLVASLLAAAWLMQAVWPAVVACVLTGVMAGNAAEAAGFSNAMPLMLGVMCAGMALSALVCLLGEKAGVKLAWVALLMTAVSGLWISGFAHVHPGLSVLCAVLVPISGLLVGMRTNYWLLVVISLAPMGGMYRFMPEVSMGWVMLAGGFVLLGLGAAASLTKERWRAAVHSGEPPHAVGAQMGDSGAPGARGDGLG